MLSQPVPLSSEAHRNTRVKQTPTIEHVKNSHLASITVHEFIVAAPEYPIAFVRTPQSGTIRPVVVWGVEPEQNLFVVDDVWQGGYVPAAVRCFPFVTSLQEVEGERRIFVGIHEESDIVNEEEGERLFDDEGKETDWFKKNIEFINTVTARDEQSLAFAKTLDEMGLIQALQVTFKDPDGNDRKIEGLLAVDPKKFAALSDEDFLKLRKQNMLDPIYAHFMSLENVNKLLSRRYKA
ncbi:MAG TPA: SapC family protein [Pseudomonadales bacterium]|nr:SapC family protein [Pseudomonadales bacterium]